MRRPDCRLCGSRVLELVLSLTPTPPANAFVPASALGEEQERFPLDVWFCRECHHVQLLDVVDPSLLFSEYVYVSGTSPAFVEHFREYADLLRGRFGVQPGDLVVDIGSNDGTLLRFFRGAGQAVLGIDPAREIAARATSDGIETLAEFFAPALAERILGERGHARIITANNVFAHVDDLAGIVTGVRTLLAVNGVFAFEVSYLVDMVEKTYFDMIYHEHLDYHSVAPLVPFFRRHGLEVFDVQRVPTHGGSIRVFVQHEGGPRAVEPSVAGLVALERERGLDSESTFWRFGEHIAATGEELRKVLNDLRAEGKSIAGYGAPAKATTLMYEFGIEPKDLDFIVDDSPWKQSLYTPGLHVPVVAAEEIERRAPDYILVLAWNFADPIIAKHTRFAERGGRFIVPLPRVEIR